MQNLGDDEETWDVTSERDREECEKFLMCVDGKKKKKLFIHILIT